VVAGPALADAFMKAVDNIQICPPRPPQHGLAWAVPALRDWRRLLRPHGALVLTDAVWTTADPSEEARTFWAQYPDMRDEAALVSAARAAGYQVLATHLLPDADWTDEYHGPLAAAIDAWPDPDPATAAVLAEARSEVDVRQAHRSEFGYLALVLRRR